MPLLQDPPPRRRSEPGDEDTRRDDGEDKGGRGGGEGQSLETRKISKKGSLGQARRFWREGLRIDRHDGRGGAADNSVGVEGSSVGAQDVNIPPAAPDVSEDLRGGGSGEDGAPAAVKGHDSVTSPRCNKTASEEGGSDGSSNCSATSRGSGRAGEEEEIPENCAKICTFLGPQEQVREQVLLKGVHGRARPPTQHLMLCSSLSAQDKVERDLKDSFPLLRFERCGRRM